MTEPKDIILTDSQMSFKKPVETPFGTLRFLTFDEYLDMQNELGWIAQNVLHLYYMILKNIPKENKEERKAARAIKELSLRDLVFDHEQILFAYQKVLCLMLDQNDFIGDLEALKDVLTDIFSKDETFLLMRAYIMKMNLLREEKVSPNAKIQELFERDREVKSKTQKDIPTHTDIVFSVASLTPNPLDKVMQMSPIQVHNFYARINADKDYERNILFATVSNEVEIESWAKKIDLFEIKDTSISKAEFDQRNAGMFK